MNSVTLSKDIPRVQKETNFLMQSASVDGFRMRVRSEYTTRGTRGIRQNIDDQ